MPTKSGARPELPLGGHNTQFAPPPDPADAAAAPLPLRLPPRPPDDADDPPVVDGAAVPVAVVPLVPVVVAAPLVLAVADGARLGRATAPPAAG